MRERKILGATLERIAEGIGKHDSLANAALYANLMEDRNTVDFLAAKIRERSALIRKLMRLNAESGFMLLPHVPHDELGGFMAIERLAVSNPGAHEILGKIAEIDKARFLVGDATTEH